MSEGRTPGLGRVLVRLKVRLIRNRARTPGSRVVLSVAVLAALVFGGMLATGLVAVGWYADERAGRTVLILGATAMFVFWVLIPLLMFGSDETLDPARLVLFPLRPRALTRALLAASFVGPAPTFAVLATLGAVAGFAGRGGWIVVPAAALLLALTATTARTLSTVLAAGLTSRRGRDITIIIASMLGLALQGIRFIRFDALDVTVMDRIDDVLRWLPPGMLAQSVIDARAGHLLVALAELIPAAVAVPVLLWCWARALERSLTVMSGGETRQGRRASHETLSLLFARLPFLRPTPWGAVAAKELRCLNRDPRRKVVVVNSTIVGLALTLYPALSSGRDARTVLLATTASYVAVLNSSNQFGFDGGGYWLDIVAGDTARATIIGKNVAAGLQVVVIVTIIAVVAAALTGGWVYLPAAVALAIAGLGAGLATADVVSVRFPVRLPQSQNPFAGRGAGQGCGTSVILLAGLLVQNLLLSPVAIAVAIVGLLQPALLVIVVPLTLVYGAVLWRVGLTIATNWARSHQPELLAAIDPDRGT